MSKSNAIKLHISGKLQEAISQYKKLLRKTPQDTDLLYFCGMAYFALNRNEIAEDYVKKAIKIQPDNFQYYNDLGLILVKQNKFDEAEMSYKNAINFNTNFSAAHNNLGILYKKTFRIDLAKNEHIKAIKIDPNNASAYNNLGIIYRYEENLAEGFKCFNNAIDIKPDYYEAFCNLGLVLHDMGKYSDALRMYKKSIDINPKFYSALFNSSISALITGDFYNGWKNYEYRIQLHHFIPEVLKVINETLLWQGQDISHDSQLIILPEQGIGDEVMFSKLVNLIQAKNKYIVLACDKRLVDIFSRSFIGIKVISINDIHSLSNIRYSIPSGSLPNLLLSSIDTIHNKEKSFLIPCLEKKEYFAKKQEGVKNLKVGISWKSGNPEVGKRRSVPLEEWLPILNTNNCTFYNLQYGEVKEDICNINKVCKNPIIIDEEIDPIKNIDAFTSFISTLDLVISIDNSTVHFSGSLGIPTWVLLPYAPDWRWMKNTKSTDWYTSIELFRQQGNSWKSTIDIVQKRISTFCHQEQQ